MWCLDILTNLFSMCLFGNNVITDDHKPETWKKKENNGSFDNVISLKYTSKMIGNEIKYGWMIPTGLVLWSDDKKADFVKELKKQGYVRDFETNNKQISPPYEL